MFFFPIFQLFDCKYASRAMDFARVTIMVSVLILASCSHYEKSIPEGRNTRSVEKPNIVLIVADDQGYADLGVMGMTEDVKTPHLDALAKRGVRFTQAYSTSPICNASRAGLMTGSYQQRQGIFWYGGPGLHDQNRQTLAQLLQENGYYNGYVGKFHYGKTRLKNARRRDFPLNHGFDFFYGFEGGRKHYLHHQAEIEDEFLRVKALHKQPGQSLAQGPMWLNKALVDQNGFTTDLFGQQARDFIETNKGRPFFLQLAFNAVHNFTHQLPERVLQKKKLQGYRDWDPSKEDYRAWYVGSRYPNNPEGRAQYLAQLELLDSEVGKVMAFLDAKGLRENTIVIYISDNGGSTPIYANNGPLRGSKYTLYEGGIRIPMIISWPGQYPEDYVSNAIVSGMDIMPTLCGEVAGCVLPGIDGIALQPVLKKSPTPLNREYLVWDTTHETAIRKGKWKLKTAVPSSQKHAVSEMVKIELGEFLYNLEEDPGEKHNLFSAHPDIVRELKSAYSDWRLSLQQ